MFVLPLSTSVKGGTDMPITDKQRVDTKVVMDHAETPPLTPDHAPYHYPHLTTI
jgi:hypothetical protein